MSLEKNQYFVTPPDLDGLLDEWKLYRVNFKKPVQPNAKGDREYLIIGFDTEYQRRLNKEGVHEDNEVLSYQFYCMVCNKDNQDKEVSWKGIAIPKSGKVEDRLTLQQFISIAISKGLKENISIQLPSEIFLVAHFTRADVPGFKDFKEDKETRNKLNFDNLRNTFINSGRDIPITLQDTQGNEIKLNIKVRDSLHLAPTGKKSLQDIGEVLGYPKIKLGKNDEEDLYFKLNMKEFRTKHWEKFREYSIKDAEICAKYIVKMMHLYKQQSTRFKLPPSLTAIGVDLIQEQWKKDGLNPAAVVGKEEFKYKVWDKKLSRYKTKTRLVEKRPFYYHIPLLTECFSGGRNEQFIFGTSYESTWYDYDLTSAYPSAMFLIGEVDWDNIKTIKDTNQLLNDFAAVDMVFADIDFEFPEDVRFPCLPVRTETGILFPKQGQTSTHISEIILAKKMGCRISLNHGIIIESKRHPRVRENKDGEKIGEVNRPFDAFTRYCVSKRREYPKKSLENLFWKELTNSTYGKTAQGLRERRVYDLKEEGTKSLPPSPITNPAYAAFITAFCRGTLSEIMNNLPQNIDIFSVTTDGFLTTATPRQMQEATKGVLCRYYKSSRRVLSGRETEIFEVKHVVKKLFGWRTRGQATLIPSSRSDWELTENPNDYDVENNRVVTAKAGIKFSKKLSKIDENKEITKLFFNRFPNQKHTIILNTGIRNMYEEGLDFVDYEITKRLSMEFDWKRKPHFVGESEVDIDGVDIKKHLFFTTTPWNSLKEYQQVREVWEDYNNNGFHVLKTKQDYDDFNEYLEAKLSAQDSNASAYIKKKNGTLLRLRRDIVCAEHATGSAGTHQKYYQALGIENIKFPTIKLKAWVLADILTRCLGIEVTEGDVTNDRKRAKKYGFVRYQTPRTREVYKALSKLKNEVFPQLQINEFLTPLTGFSIASCELEECSFSRKLLPKQLNLNL